MANNEPSFRQLSAFFIPLALQATAQSITYPLVAMVASAGPGGALNLAGVAQSNTLMFLVGTLGAGLVTSGMVYATTRQGYRKFVSVNTGLALATAAIQALLCIPFLSHLVFGTLMGLPVSIERPADQAYPWTIPLQWLFFMRNPYQVILYNHGESGKASIATFSRVGVTLALSPILTAVNLVGPTWAMMCQIFGVAAELGLSRWFSGPYLSRLRSDHLSPPRRREILGFNIPLSIGGLLMNFCSLFLAAFIARARAPEHTLPAYYLVIGIVNPVAWAAGRITNVVLRFPPVNGSRPHTLKFAMLAGAVISVVPLIFLIPGIAQWYYIGQQRLDPNDLPLVYGAALWLLLFPFLIGLRSHQEGLAANARKTHAILAGNIAYLAALAVLGFELLELGVAGNLIGPIATIMSNIVGLATITFMLRHEEKKETPPVVLRAGQDFE